MKFPKITSIMLVLTHLCNLRCRYCFVDQKAQTMTLETAKEVADWLNKNCEESKQTPSINFFGGEPTLCWDSIIVPLTRYIRSELKVPFQLSITTNGTLLNDEKIAFMKENNISMLFSIDGNKATQDYNRPCADGNGSFDILSPIIPKIAQNFNTTFRMTVIPATCKNVFENIKFAADSGFRSFFLAPNVFEDWSDESFETVKVEFRKYGDYYIDCYNKGVDPISFSTFESAFVDIQKINSAIRFNTYRDNTRARNKCGLGATRFAAVHPTGDIYACQEMTSNEGKNSIFWIGNIYDGVDNARRANLVEMFDAEDHSGVNCENCRYRRICDGGCVANNYLATGSVNKLPIVYCRWIQIVLDEAIRVMQILGSSNEKFIAEWRKRNGIR